jgi:hypothetical protein
MPLGSKIGCSGGHPVSSVRNSGLKEGENHLWLEWLMESKRNNRAIHVDNHKNKVIDVEKFEVYTQYTNI